MNALEHWARDFIAYANGEPVADDCGCACILVPTAKIDELRKALQETVRQQGVRPIERAVPAPKHVPATVGRDPRTGRVVTWYDRQPQQATGARPPSAAPVAAEDV